MGRKLANLGILVGVLLVCAGVAGGVVGCDLRSPGKMVRENSAYTKQYHFENIVGSGALIAGGAFLAGYSDIRKISGGRK